MSLDIRRFDALDFLKSLPDREAQLVATDPPYFRVKDEPWDRAWDTADGFLSWLDVILAEVERVLAPNGSLYLFASPRMSARVEVLIGERFNVLTRITWAKPKFSTKAEMFRKEDLRAPFPSSESIIFAEPFTASDSWTQAADGVRGSVFEPLRAYIADEFDRAGVKAKDVAEAMGVTPTMVQQHYLSRSQWHMPTPTAYDKMRQALAKLNHGGQYLRREYEDLRREYEDLRREYEDLRRPFNVTPADQYTDVWAFPTVNHYPGKHSCEKPLEMMEQIIRSSSRPGDLVVDPFMGSGTTAVAAQNLGRRFAGCDLDQRWVDRTAERLQQVTLPL